MRGTHLAVLAVDLPKMVPEWFVELQAQCGPGSGVVGRREGFFEPLAAIYPREIGPAFADAGARGDFSLQRLLADTVARGGMSVREITEPEWPGFENWNAPK
jgi:molybdopterin-guanine dinucleotide biosynthesis protein A